MIPKLGESLEFLYWRDEDGDWHCLAVVIVVPLGVLDISLDQIPSLKVDVEEGKEDNGKELAEINGEERIYVLMEELLKLTEISRLSPGNEFSKPGYQQVIIEVRLKNRFPELQEMLESDEMLTVFQGLEIVNQLQLLLYQKPFVRGKSVSFTLLILFGLHDHLYVLNES